jgi:hypothetical protein
MYSYEIDESIDIVLLDLILDFYRPDKKKEMEFLLRIMNEIMIGGLLCVIIWKSGTTEKELMEVFDRTSSNWIILADKYIKYHYKRMELRMIIKKKVE